MGYSNWSTGNSFTTKTTYGVGSEHAKITGINIDDFFGTSVSINSTGDTVVVGIVYAGLYVVTSKGYVKVYKLISGTWTQQGITLQGDGDNDYFGRSVSINGAGDIVAIGAYNAGYGTGYVKIYKNISGTWTLQGAKINGEAVGDYFGYSVSINDLGDIVVIGAFAANTQKGYAKVYKNISNSWTLQGAKIIGEVTYDRFSNYLNINKLGDIVAIGASSANNETGYVKVYKLISGTWTLQGAKILGESNNNVFGIVAINALGNIIVVGAFSASGGIGYAKVYELISGTWTQQVKLIGEGTVQNYFGKSVSINDTGDIIAVGAPVFNNNVGYVKIYKNISGTWTQQVKLDGEATLEQYGLSVSLNSTGDTLVVGAPFANSTRGYIKIYK
jgi:hypothetical protein